MAELLSIILAAGRSTRMNSTLPKVLHPMGGLPLVSHVLRAATEAGSSRIALVSRPEHQVVRDLADAASSLVQHIEQPETGKGTGFAAQVAMAGFDGFAGHVISLLADAPLVTKQTIEEVAAKLDAGADIVVVGFTPDDPKRFGRFITEGDKLVAIREFAEASAEELAIRDVNSGIIGFRAGVLRSLLPRLKEKGKGERYLTDTVELANADGLKVQTVMRPEMEVMGVDDRSQLARAETQFQELRREDFMKAGVTLKDPASVYFSWDTEIGKDTLIEPHVVFGPGVKIGEGVKVFAFSHIAETTLGDRVEVGPFVRLRGKTVLGEEVHLGNFVEAKNARIAAGTKAMHLSYLGDTVVGTKTNVGAGTITCNYDGVNKEQTTIGDNVFVGSNSSLVAPVTIGDRAYIGSGSVITEDVPADALAFGRARQENKPGYAPKIREKALAKKAAKGKS